jgi:hypothetical protein
MLILRAPRLAGNVRESDCWQELKDFLGSRDVAQTVTLDCAAGLFDEIALGIAAKASGA